MIDAYSFRLLCSCLAAFFLIHLALGLAVSRLAPRTIRMAERIPSVWAARLLLTLRLLPAGLGMLIVLGLCAPSYLWFEPRAADEQVGGACFAAAGLSVCIWGIGIYRAARAWLESRRLYRRWLESGEQMPLSGETAPVHVIDEQAPVFALAGILRPRLMVARAVVDALTPGELAAALLHEQAHMVSRDNLKRLIVLLTPRILPFVDAFRTLESGWAKFAEWAADDWAAGGNAGHSTDLAAALVRVARMGTHASPLMTSLSAGGADLAPRVDRLLAGQREARRPRTAAFLWAAAAALFAIAWVSITSGPAVLQSVYRLL
jgi:Zn-dependent protease with chaperone function